MKLADLHNLHLSRQVGNFAKFKHQLLQNLKKMSAEDGLKKVISHAKEYGFVFPSSEIYDGLSAAYDYGQLGSELKDNLGSTGGLPW